MHCRLIQSGDVARISEWNRQLQIDEGATAMSLEAIEARLSRWLGGQYEARIFALASEPIAYALYRPTDSDQMEAGGIYLRQFFVARAFRRAGHGSAAIRLFLDEVVRGRRLVLEALDSNREGQAFWRSVGMRVYSVAYELRPAEATTARVARNE